MLVARQGRKREGHPKIESNPRPTQVIEEKSENIRVRVVLFDLFIRAAKRMLPVLRVLQPASIYTR